MPKRRFLAAGAALTGVAAAVSFGLSTDLTEAQRHDSKFTETEFKVTVAPRFQLEGSADGTTWHDGGEPVQSLDFSPDRLALKVGEENAIFAPMRIRLAAGANTSATAHITETGLDTSAFSQALRGEVYLGAQSCDATGTEEVDVDKLTADATLQGQTSDNFEVTAPATTGEPGSPVNLCVKVWLDNNTWLIVGDQPPEQTATWTVTATS